MATDLNPVIDITRTLLRIGAVALEDLERLLPAPDEPAFGAALQRLAQLTADLDARPESALADGEDDRLEALLVSYGPGDPFASLPQLSMAELVPGDMVVRCGPALSSQLTEFMIWSRYTHTGLYLGDGMIIDSTWLYGVKKRPLAELLGESNRVSVLRIPGLAPAQARGAQAAAESQEAAPYNFTGLTMLAAQKLEVLTASPPQRLGQLLGVLGRAEVLPPDAGGTGTYACSELVAFAFEAVGITLTHAGGFTPGDLVRLSDAGLVRQVGRLRPEASPL